jgi:hypothetical protein
MDSDPSDLQTLRLLKAFFKVTNMKTRELIVALAESAARPGTTLTVMNVDTEQPPDKLN